MSIRVVRHLGARSCAADDSKLLVGMPYGALEDLRHMRVDAWCCSTDDEHFIDQGEEVNWLVLAVPWSVILTHFSDRSAMSSATTWDSVWRRLVLEQGTDGNEYYGGETSHYGTEVDVIPGPGEVLHTSLTDEPYLSASQGPIGIRRLYSREVLMRPYDGAQSGTNAEKARFYDEFNTSFDGPTRFQSGGVILGGMLRYNEEAETNFNAIQLSGETEDGLRPLIGGDISRVQSIIRTDTAGRGDTLRTIMFGGDNFIEADTLKGVTVKAYMKTWTSFTTPYTINAF